MKFTVHIIVHIITTSMQLLLMIVSVQCVLCPGFIVTVFDNTGVIVANCNSLLQFKHLYVNDHGEHYYILYYFHLFYMYLWVIPSTQKWTTTSGLDEIWWVGNIILW